MKALFLAAAMVAASVASAQNASVTSHQLTAATNGFAVLDVPAGITASVTTLAANKPVYLEGGNLSATRLALFWPRADGGLSASGIYLRRGDKVEGPARLALFAGGGDYGLAYVQFEPTLPLAAVRVEASKDGSNWTVAASIPMTTREQHQLFRLKIEPAKLPE